MRSLIERVGVGGVVIAIGVLVIAASNLGLSLDPDYAGGCLFECDANLPDWFVASLYGVLGLALVGTVLGVADVVAGRTARGLAVTGSSIVLIVLEFAVMLDIL